MAKKPAPKKAAPKGKSGTTADDHRRMAAEHSAKARLHSARADLADAMNPPKGGKRVMPY
jgi:hypothetical protein